MRTQISNNLLAFAQKSLLRKNPFHVVANLAAGYHVACNVAFNVINAVYAYGRRSAVVTSTCSEDAKFVFGQVEWQPPLFSVEFVSLIASQDGIATFACPFVPRRLTFVEPRRLGSWSSRVTLLETLLGLMGAPLLGFTDRVSHMLWTRLRNGFAPLFRVLNHASIVTQTAVGYEV